MELPMEPATPPRKPAPLALGLTPDGARLLESVLCRECDAGTLLQGADVPEARALVADLDALITAPTYQPTLESARAGEPARLFEPTHPTGDPSGNSSGLRNDPPPRHGGLPLFEEAAPSAAR